MQEQQQRSRGTEIQLQEKVLDPSGFQPRWKDHERELMIFIAMEYDSGASIHLSTHQPINMRGMHSRMREASPSHFSFKNISHDQDN
jgi:hypothetical protein